MQVFCLHNDNKNKKLPVLSIDVTDGGLGVSSSSNGTLLIWLTENGQIRVGFFKFIYLFFHFIIYSIFIFIS